MHTWKAGSFCATFAVVSDEIEFAFQATTNNFVSDLA